MEVQSATGRRAATLDTRLLIVSAIHYACQAVFFGRPQREREREPSLRALARAPALASTSTMLNELAMSLRSGSRSGGFIAQSRRSE